MGVQENMKNYVAVAFLVCLFLSKTCWADKTLTFVNNSGCTDTQIFVLVWSYNQPSDGYPRHLNMTNGTLSLCSTNDNIVPVAGQTDLYCDYYVPLSQIRQTNGLYSFTFPKLVSARLYISIGAPVYLHINAPASPSDPPGVREPNITATNDPNYTTTFDIFEWTDDDAGLHANTTCANFFCLPLKFTMINADSSSAGTNGFACSRSTVTNALSANELLQPLLFSYRFLSPESDLTGAYFPTNYFDPYVDYCWNYYKTNALTITGVVDAAYFAATGGVNDVDQMILIDADNVEMHTIGKPSSLEVFSCNGVFNPVGAAGPVNDRDGFVKDEVASALNRTVMHTPFPTWGTVSNFYQQNGLSTNVYRYNIYSAILHQIAIDHKVYGYSWDDKYDQESYISSTNGNSLIVTLNRLNSAISAIPSIMLLTE